MKNFILGFVFVQILFGHTYAMEQTDNCTSIQNVPVEEITPIISIVLEKIVSKSDCSTQLPSTPFDCPTASTPVPNFIRHVKRLAKCSETCFVLAFIYLDRICRDNKNFVLTSSNFPRLWITAIMVAAKFYDEPYFKNTYYALVGYLCVEKLNQLEIDFLFLINFDLFVSERTYDKYTQELINRANEILKIRFVQLHK